MCAPGSQVHEVEVTFITVFHLVKWFPLYIGKITYSTEKNTLYRRTLLTRVDKTLAVACQMLHTHLAVIPWWDCLLK